MNKGTINDIDINYLKRMPKYSSFTYSEPNNLLAYYKTFESKTSINCYDFNLNKELFVYSTDDLRPEFSLKFLKNDAIVFYKPIKSGSWEGNIFKISLKTGQLMQLTNYYNHIIILCETSNDGKYIFFVSDLEKESMELYRINEDGTGLIRLTYHRTEVWPFNVFISHDDKYIAYSCIENIATGISKNERKNIWIMRINGDDKLKIHSPYNGRPGTMSFDGILNCWSKDKKYIGMTFETDRYLKPVLYDLEKKIFVWFDKSAFDEVFGFITSDSKYLFTVRFEGAFTKTVKYLITTGKEIGSLNHEGKVFPVSMISNPEGAIFQVESSIIPPKLVKINLYSLEKQEFLPNDSTYSLATNYHSSQYIKIQSLDRSIIYALLYIPKHFNPNKRYPSIIQAHGGPDTHYSDDFEAEIQCLVDKGFVLLLPNVRGSTGYGIHFRNVCLKDWAGKDLEDIIGCRNFLCSLSYIDDKRIGLLGESYGGYLVYNALVKFPQYWKTAVVMSAWANLLSLYNYYKRKAAFNILWMENQMGNPEKNEKLWFDRSPINFLQNMKAKLLILHGENDSIIPISEAFLVRDYLIKINYKKFTLEIYQDVGHGYESASVEKGIEIFNKILNHFLENL